jgi:type I restriction enzyme S subunit
MSDAVRRYKRYAAYKDSGVEWLGEVPSHWSVTRLKNVSQLNPESLREDTEPSREILYVDIGSVDGRGFIASKEFMRFENAPSRARRLVRAGDVIVSTVRTYLRAIASIADPDPALVVSTGFAVVRPRPAVDATFAAYALRAPYFVERIVAHSSGVSFPAINESEMSTFAVALPPIEEQREIVSFLNRELAKVDALVAKKERLIELLEEKRSALVTRAVTKGLDPNVPMKYSGAAWLGRIPVSWGLVPSTWLFHESKERALEDDQQLSATQKYGVIPQAEFERLEGRQVVHAYMHLDQRKHVEIDDFVMSMRSFQGGLERVRARGCVRSSYVVLKPSGEVDVSFFSYLFKSDAYIQALRATSNFIRDGQDLNFMNFRSVRLPLLSLTEQKAIAEFLEGEVRLLDETIRNAVRVIDYLNELRTALISAAVTGKIDVREEVA